MILMYIWDPALKRDINVSTDIYYWHEEKKSDFYSLSNVMREKLSSDNFLHELTFRL